MRSRTVLLALSVYLAFAALACSKKDSTTSDNSSATAAAPPATDSQTSPPAPDAASEPTERKELREAKRVPVVIPAGTSITISLGSALGSRLSQSGQSFNGSVSKGVLVGNEVAIPKGASVSGTVTDAKPLGKFAGGAELQVQLDSVEIHGRNLPVQASPKTFSAKGKGKRTAVLAGGGAALGGLIGGLAGGGKGAAIGLAAGGGAGAGGAALTGNKDIVLPAESAVSFELSHSLEVRR